MCDKIDCKSNYILLDCCFGCLHFCGDGLLGFCLKSGNKFMAMSNVFDCEDYERKIGGDINVEK